MAHEKYTATVRESCAADFGTSHMSQGILPLVDTFFFKKLFL